jgi:putative transposase
MRHPARLHESCYVGATFIFLTTSTYKRRPYFAEPANVQLVTAKILPVADLHGFALFAYCFMPDHLHALVAGIRRNSDFQAFVKVAKQRSGYHFKRARATRLWQPSFFDRTLRSGEEPHEAVRYVVANPVRAGLVSTVSDYEHWGSSVFTRQELLDYVGTPDLKVRGSI